MQLRVIILVVIATTLVCVAAQPKKPAVKANVSKPAPTSLVLLYTAGADGQIRSCNCTKFRFGGYGRELTLLKQIRSASKDVILIEGGDVVGGSGFQADLKADVAAQALDLLEYGVMIPGEKELGVRSVRYIERFSPKTPIVCANLFKSGETKPIFPPYTVLKTANGLRVAIIGLVDDSLCSPWLAASYGETAGDAGEVLPSVVKDARKSADLVVLAIHGGAEIKIDPVKLKGVDLIITTHRHSQDRFFPEKDKNIVDVPVTEKLGGAVLINSETSTNWCLGRLDIQLAQNHTIKSVTHKLVYLDRSFEEDPAMVAVYNAYNKNVEKSVLASSASFKKQAEELLVKRGLNLAEMRQRLHKSVFATAEQCKDCHPEIYKIWSTSKPAHAIETLRKTNQEFDPECVKCHATGTMQRNGFVNAKDTAELCNVQCEACHGPALEHIKKPEKGFGKVGEASCRSCHTDERTPDFEYSIEWAQIMH